MMLSFTLSMPNVGSWNGKWTGEENLYARVRNLGNTKKGREKAESLKGYYSYNFGDGWSAGVTVEEIDRVKAARIRRNSRGFCGYDWMIDSIVGYGRILDSRHPCAG